jgi:hypothetical protein
VNRSPASPRALPSWPDPLLTAAGAASVFAVAAVLWPSLAEGSAALAALTGVVALARGLDPDGGWRGPPARRCALPAIAYAAGWSAFLLLPAPAFARALLLSLPTLVLALALGPALPREVA